MDFLNIFLNKNTFFSEKSFLKLLKILHFLAAKNKGKNWPVLAPEGQCYDYSVFMDSLGNAFWPCKFKVFGL